jgi:hypothetical protein
MASDSATGEDGDTTPDGSSEQLLVSCAAPRWGGGPFFFLDLVGCMGPGLCSPTYARPRGPATQKRSWVVSQLAMGWASWDGRGPGWAFCTQGGVEDARGKGEVAGPKRRGVESSGLFRLWCFCVLLPVRPLGQLGLWPWRSRPSLSSVSGLAWLVVRERHVWRKSVRPRRCGAGRAGPSRVRYLQRYGKGQGSIEYSRMTGTRPRNLVNKKERGGQLERRACACTCKSTLKIPRKYQGTNAELRRPRYFGGYPLEPRVLFLVLRRSVSAQEPSG